MCATESLAFELSVLPSMVIACASLVTCQNQRRSSCEQLVCAGDVKDNSNLGLDGHTSSFQSNLTDNKEVGSIPQLDHLLGQGSLSQRLAYHWNWTAVVLHIVARPYANA